MQMKKRFFVATATALGLVLGTAQIAQAQTVLTLADIYTRDHSNSLANQRLADLVEERSNGELRIEVYNDATIGNERELAEMVVSGTIDIAPSGVSGIGRFFPSVQVLELPYLYRDLDHLVDVANVVTADVDAIFQTQGVYNLGFWFMGPRAIASSRAINHVDDLQGLRLRVPESPLYVGLAQFMGANPTPVAFTEVYTSLETGVAEAAEGEPISLWTTKWYEPTRCVSLTNHIWHFRQIPMNKARFDSLSPEHQEILRQSVADAMVYQASLVTEGNVEALANIEAEGVEIIETQGLDELAERFVEFHDSFAADLGPEAVELLEKVRSVE